MNLVSGLKKSNGKHGTKYKTTDGRSWNDCAIANEWQKSLNKSAVKVLKGKKPATDPKTKTKRKHPTSLYGIGGLVGVTPERRKAMRAFIIKHNIAKSNAGNVISMNRLIWAMQSNPKAVREFAELFAIV